MREIVFDTETTGLSPDEGHRLVEIGCVELFNRCETGEYFHAYINPERSMPVEAEAVHGLSESFLRGQRLFADVATDLVAFLGDSPLVAHNANFDFAFLNAELKTCGLAPVAMSRMVDTLAMARTRHPGAKHSLDALCSRYGVDRSQRIKHGALLDAQLLSQIYIELAGGRQIGLSLATSAPILESATGVIVAVERPYRAPRPHRATETELAAHAAFIETLVDPLWSTFSTAA